jgi:3-deoxy-D-arabino-heptulosonate 7-phosphate (DAHP) synthase
MKVNKYIQSLINDNKLNLSVQADQWKFGKNPFIISGPCSVESEEMIGL